MSTVLLAAGTKGKRFALPNSRVMIHQPSGGAGARRPTSRLRRGKSYAGARLSTRRYPSTPARRSIRSKKDSDRDYYLSAQEAKAYGLVDHVVDSTREAKAIAVQSAA